MKMSHGGSSNERSKDKLDRLSSQIAIESRGDAFGKFATTASGWLGSKWAFVVAILVIAIWAITGPLFHYSDTWQLVINTGTTIVTFLMIKARNGRPSGFMFMLALPLQLLRIHVYRLGVF